MSAEGRCAVCSRVLRLLDGGWLPSHKAPGTGRKCAGSAAKPVGDAASAELGGGPKRRGCCSVCGREVGLVLAGGRRGAGVVARHRRGAEDGPGTCPGSMKPARAQP